MVDTCPINILEVGFGPSGVTTEPIQISDDEGEVAPAQLQEIPSNGFLDDGSLHEATQVDCDANGFEATAATADQGPQTAEVEQAPLTAEVGKATPAPTAEVDQASTTAVDQEPLTAEVDQAPAAPTSQVAQAAPAPIAAIAEASQDPKSAEVDKARDEKPASDHPPAAHEKPCEPKADDFDVMDFKVHAM